MSRASILVLVVAALVGAGCQESIDEGVAPTTRFERDTVLRYHMHNNYDLVKAIEQLVIRGKLEEARTLARIVAASPEDAGLAGWKSAGIVRARAEAVAAAPSVDEAARSAARLAAACADCHRDAGVLPEFALAPPVPADLPSVEARMARHRWATARLWEAMIGANDQPWITGLDVLATTPLPWRDITGDRELLARRLQTLADTSRRRAKPEPPDEKARIYGEILVTCAACHATGAAGQDALKTGSVTP